MHHAAKQQHGRSDQRVRYNLFAVGAYWVKTCNSHYRLGPSGSVNLLLANNSANIRAAGFNHIYGSLGPVA